MKSLDTLLRLKKWQVDQARRRLSELYAERSTVDRLASELEEGIRAEQAHGAQSVDGAFLYASYIAAVQRQRLLLEQKAQEVDEAILDARDQASRAYRAQKKYDVLAEQQRIQRHRDALKADQKQYDETAAVRHRR